MIGPHNSRRHALLVRQYRPGPPLQRPARTRTTARPTGGATAATANSLTKPIPAGAADTTTIASGRPRCAARAAVAPTRRIPDVVYYPTRLSSVGGTRTWRPVLIGPAVRHWPRRPRRRPRPRPPTPSTSASPSCARSAACSGPFSSCCSSWTRSRAARTAAGGAHCTV